MKTETEIRVLAREIAREHGHIRSITDELRAEIERQRAGPLSAAGYHRLAGMLAIFRVHLCRHFSFEEQGAFFGRPAPLDPTGRRQIEKLLDEHRAFEKELASLLDASLRADQGDASLTSTFADTLEKLIDRLSAHEREENLLAQEMVNRDTGAGD